MNINFFRHHFKEQRIMSVAFGHLRFEILPGIWELGFGTSETVK
jgi:hypothetical protein